MEPLYDQILKDIAPNATLLRYWPLNGGISCETTGLEVEHPELGTQKLVVRHVGEWSFEHYPESAKNEFNLLVHLDGQGIPVPKARHFDLSCSLLPRPFLVLDYVDGSPDLTATNVIFRATDMAVQLAKIHQLDVKHPVFSFMKPSPVNLRPLTGEPNEDLQETKIRKVLTEWLPRVKENEYRFRHGDYWPGNMLWKNNKLAAVIDWEETSIGDPLFDVAIARLDILWAYGLFAMDAFTQHYFLSIPEVDPTFLPFWDLRVSLRPIQNIGTWATSFPVLDRPDVTEDLMAQRHRWFVDEAMLRLERMGVHERNDGHGV
ncbi:MAG: aminoglycoside phosphotransferase family protein [Armatimonadota bacterium]